MFNKPCPDAITAKKVPSFAANKRIRRLEPKAAYEFAWLPDLLRNNQLEASEH